LCRVGRRRSLLRDMLSSSGERGSSSWSLLALRWESTPAPQCDEVEYHRTAARLSNEKMKEQ
jgi:hypothetical protein